MSRLDELEQFTKTFKEKLEEQSKKKNKEDLIHLVNKHLDERQLLIDQLSSPYLDKEKQQLLRILNHDKEMQEVLNHVFQSIKNDMRQAKKQKTSNQQYLNPYQNVATVDGTYWDKKK
ncbi:flagellar protein FliT [Halolactibacillus miurensis]|uniref:Flagellar protein FliT n=1 Tax=Halolactibacillus miurensis TaxID=306541 RepID=A0A1I6U0H4_9BACI|nr:MULTISPECIES: flagellar protein FliT [Halolactibacillus]GEM04879.1 flagellar protein FliT [Halolactibacillus miurensis]SFS94915.1 flagellar protein FliT [Halolactibacillus miurensis]